MTTHNAYTRALRGFTNLTSMLFTVESGTGVGTLVLELAKAGTGTAHTIRAEFRDVSNFCVCDFGGGVTQLLLLTVNDISERQLDRIKYEVVELEREAIKFFCAGISISTLPN